MEIAIFNQNVDDQQCIDLQIFLDENRLASRSWLWRDLKIWLSKIYIKVMLYY
jgi:hypothetical protein